ncbi:MAG: UDP-glucose 4-epimerase GalE, partial [Acholeplasmataceae bacterium]
STGHKEFVPKKAKLYLGDITKTNDVENVFIHEKIDAVMHFAAKIIVPESVEKPLEYYYNNVEGVRVLLESVVKHGIKYFVFSSTAAVYGDAKGVCHENDVTMPINPYGETKLTVEKMIKWTANAYDLNYVIFRYFNVAGADKTLEIGYKSNKPTHLIPIANEAALGIRDHLDIYGNDYETPDGTCIRDYVHVTDLAQAHVLGVEYLKNKGVSKTMNLGSNHGFSVLEVVKILEKIKPIKYQFAPRRDGDPALLVASNDQAKKILGWQPKLTLEDMIKSDLAYHQK